MAAAAAGRGVGTGAWAGGTFREAGAGQIAAEADPCKGVVVEEGNLRRACPAWAPSGAGQPHPAGGTSASAAPSASASPAPPLASAARPAAAGTAGIPASSSA